MISRVNKAPVVVPLTAQTKQSENDPGNSSGSGNFYEAPPQPKAPEESKAEEQEMKAEVTSKPELVLIEGGGGKQKVKSLNSVYLEFFKNKMVHATAGLTTQYSSDHENAKGMLLNKKVE